MRKRKRRKALIEFTMIVLLLTCCAILLKYSFDNKPAAPADGLQAARACFADEDWTEAIRYLRLYCQSESDDMDAYILLGDCYQEQGQQDRADDAYRRAALLQPVAENELNEKYRMRMMDADGSQLSIRIEPAVRYTRNMTLCFSGATGNLASAAREYGRINCEKESLIADESCRTTAWFSVHSEMKYLFLMGNFNCAVWQFKDAEGNIQLVNNDLDYMSLSSVRHSSLSFDTVLIPTNAVAARVMYRDANIVNAALGNDEIFIGYGMLPTGYTGREVCTMKIPDLVSGQYVLYEQGKWRLWNGEEWEQLDWADPAILADTILSIDGDLCGKVTVTSSKPKAEQAPDPKLEYGVRFNVAAGLSIGERLGAAQGLRFNCAMDGGWLHAGGNDFDSAYPWSEIRRCNIAVAADGNRMITYEGEPGFSLDGSAGNVMVEIPKFYVKRDASEGFEEIWISGSAHEGYELEPVFIGADGQELDCVYMSAYMGAEQEGRITSVVGTYPTLMLSYGDTLRMAKNNGAGFSEVSFMMYSALQKLFMVEVGTLDSSSVFAGDTMQCYFYDVEDLTRSCLAAEDAEHSNTIVLYDNYNTEKLAQKDSIALLTDWKTYANNTAIRRQITSIERRDGKAYVTFDGEPVNIYAETTAISGIPAITGNTDSLDYHTGAAGKNDGKSSFKYRHIENLYGSALVMLNDDAYMQDGSFRYETADGETCCLNASIAEQPRTLSSYKTVNMNSCVKTMTFDPENPTVMLPSAVGDGASTHTGYGDYWMWSNLRGRRYFLYGGAGDNGKAAGLFQYRAVVYSEATAFSFYSARIMYRD